MSGTVFLPAIVKTQKLGSCWSCVTDVSMPSTMATGARAVAEAVLRRWQTPRGTLVDDPNYGYDLTSLVGADVDLATLGQGASLASAEALKDERVLTCDVQITLQADGSLIVTGNGRTSDGPFQLVLSVNAVSVNLLQLVPR